MPLIYQHNINRNTKLGVWRIDEPESFFLKRVPLKSDVTHPHKRLQHLAGRYLLPALYDDFPLEEIVVADTRKPFLENEKYHFSISHSSDFAAAIVSSTKRVGVDIEMVGPRVMNIRHKFLHAGEYISARTGQGDVTAPAYVGQDRQHEDAYSDEELLTLLWSAKESIYKWYGSGKINFQDHIRLTGPVLGNKNDFLEMPFVFLKSDPVSLNVGGKFFEQTVLAWVTS